MNIYDTKTISCRTCGRSIGEIDYDADKLTDFINPPFCGLKYTKKDQ